MGTLNSTKVHVSPHEFGKLAAPHGSATTLTARLPSQRAVDHFEVPDLNRRLKSMAKPRHKMTLQSRIVGLRSRAQPMKLTPGRHLRLHGRFSAAGACASRPHPAWATRVTTATPSAGWSRRTARCPTSRPRPIGARKTASRQSSTATEAPFCRLNNFRRVATRYDRLAINFLAAVCIAAAVSYWL